MCGETQPLNDMDAAAGAGCDGTCVGTVVGGLGGGGLLDSTRPLATTSTST